MNRELALSELKFIELKLPTNRQIQINDIAQKLLSDDKIKELLVSVKVLKKNNKRFAYEHFFLLLSLRNLNPNLKINVTIISIKDADIEKRIANYIALNSATLVDAIKVSSFEHYNLKPKQKLFNRITWAKLLNKHRSTLNATDKQFHIDTSDTDRIYPLDIKTPLDDVPDLTKIGGC